MKRDAIGEMVLEQIKDTFLDSQTTKHDIQAHHEQIQQAMKSGDVFKGIFGLAIRLLGLVFLYFGLSGVPPLLDVGAIETAARSDIITAILPIVFNLAVAWWLIGGGWLLRRAYPDAPRVPTHPRQTTNHESQETRSAPAGKLTEMEQADKKLAALVEKPNASR